MAAIANDFGRAADGRGHHLVADHQHAQVVAFVITLQQHALVEHAGTLDGFLHLARRAQINCHALALFTVDRLDHHRAMLGEKGGIVFGATGQALRRYAEVGARQGAMSQALVLAQGHAHGAGQVAQRFAAADASAAVAEGEQPGLGVVHLHFDAAAQRLVDDDTRVGVELGLRARTEEQRLVDAVLALEAEGLQLAEAELGVKLLGLFVVVQHRQVEVAQATAHAVLDQMTDQHLADARAAALRVDRQAPEAAAVFRVTEGALVVEAHDAADHRAAVFVLGQPVGRAALVVGREFGRVDRQHAAGLVQAVDRLPVGVVLRPANAETTEATTRWAVVGKPQAQGVGGVEEQLLRRMRQYLMRCGHVKRDIALAGLFAQQGFGQRPGVGVGMADQQAAPAAMDGLRLTGLAAVILGQACLQTLVGGCLAAQQALVEGSGAHGIVPVRVHYVRSEPDRH